MQPIFQKSLGSHLALIAEMPTLPISPGGSRNFTPTPGLTVTYFILPEFMFFDVIVTFFVVALYYHSNAMAYEQDSISKITGCKRTEICSQTSPSSYKQR